jgi:hypothetical protein
MKANLWRVLTGPWLVAMAFPSPVAAKDCTGPQQPGAIMVTAQAGPFVAGIGTLQVSVNIRPPKIYVPPSQKIPFELKDNGPVPGAGQTNATTGLDLELQTAFVPFESGEYKLTFQVRADRRYSLQANDRFVTQLYEQSLYLAIANPRQATGWSTCKVALFKTLRITAEENYTYTVWAAERTVPLLPTNACAGCVQAQSFNKSVDLDVRLKPPTHFTLRLTPPVPGLVLGTVAIPIPPLTSNVTRPSANPFSTITITVPD